MQRGLRDEAISLLEEAVTPAPVDLAIHRRLVAVYANAGDATSAKCEHARFIEACLDGDDAERARAELDYARQTVGDSAALRELEHRIATGAPKRVGPRPAVVVASVTPAPVPPQAPAQAQAATAEERAIAYLGQRDPRAAAECLTVARELIEAHKDRAAADLLIAHVASGMRDRDVQRLLITVDRALGRSDIAAEKAELLSRILELDGDPIGARAVQKLARAS